MSYGRSHYILGYLIVTVGHNWPVLVALLATLICAVAVWRRPNRRRLAALYGWAMLAVLYEYHKHIVPRFVEAAMFLVGDSAPLYSTMRFVVEPFALGLQGVLALGFLLYAALPHRSLSR